MIRVVTTSPLTAEQQATVLAFVQRTPGRYADEEVAFELGEAIEVDCRDELFGATLITFVSYYFSGEGGEE